MLNSLASFLVAIGLLVFLHELGHYSVARYYGVKVLRFSVGFGKPIVRWTSKKTGVEWTIGWLPLGGYVRMLDERDPESVEMAHGQLQDAFNRKPVLQRMAVVLAGPLANLLVAAALYSVVSMGQTQQLAAVTSTPAAGSLAQQAGLQAGDRVVGVNGARTDDWSALTWGVLQARIYRDDLTLQVERGGSDAHLQVSREALMALPFTPDLPNKLGFRPFEREVQVKKVMPNTAAARAGLQEGDVLLALDGQSLMNSAQFTEAIRNSAGKIVTIELLRSGARLSLTAKPDVFNDPASKTTQGRLGVSVGGTLMIEDVNHGFMTALGEGFSKTWEISVFSLAALVSMVSGDLSWDNLSGPVSIASAAGESSSLGILPFLGFLAMVSVSLGVLNLLPIPVLDGGHLMYYLAELVRGKPLSEAWQHMGQRIGLLLIGFLTCLAFFNDLQRLL